jgi:hypothetical protein
LRESELSLILFQFKQEIRRSGTPPWLVSIKHYSVILKANHSSFEAVDDVPYSVPNLKYILIPLIGARSGGRRNLTFPLPPLSLHRIV